MKKSRQQEPKRQNAQPRKRKYDRKTGLTVFEPNVVYFNEYLEIHIGAKWNAIKRSLYDAGYQTAEVSAYRDGLLEDFGGICETNGFRGIV